MRSRKDEGWLNVIASTGWWLALAVLTYGLCSSVPPRINEVVVPTAWQFFASKCVHLGSFFVLSLAASLLARTSGYRIFLILTLVGHAALTEYVQTFVDGRHGCIQDVCINWTGVLLGLLVARGLRWLYAKWAARVPRGLSATTTAT